MSAPAGVPRGFVKVETLVGDGSAFSALAEADRWAKGRGWSVGPPERSEPIALGRFDRRETPKWRYLKPRERAALDGVIAWPLSCRDGPAEIWVSWEHAAAWEGAP